MRKIFVYVILVVQMFVVIFVEVRVHRLEKRLGQIEEILSNNDTALKATDTSLKAIARFECDQQKVNFFFHESISGDKPYYHPLIVSEDCKAK